MDHTNSLPFFIENVYGKSDGPIDIHASSATIYALRKYLFNNATWPDFTRLPNHLLPAVRFLELESEVPVVIDGVKFTPIPVDHLVPTHGFLIESNGAAVLWSSDTGPTQRFWEVANRTPNLKALCIDTSFDNSLQQVADVSLHLTPRTLETELRKAGVSPQELTYTVVPFPDMPPAFANGAIDVAIARAHRAHPSSPLTPSHASHAVFLKSQHL